MSIANSKCAGNDQMITQPGRLSGVVEEDRVDRVSCVDSTQANYQSLTVMSVQATELLLWDRLCYDRTEVKSDGRC
jgi:hypothetical protein